MSKIQITCDTPDSQIYYSLDGSDPNSLYSEPFELNQEAIIKAVGKKEGYIDSDPFDFKCFTIKNTGVDEKQNYDDRCNDRIYVVIKDSSTKEILAHLDFNEIFLVKEGRDVYITSDFKPIEDTGSFRPDHSAGSFYCSFNLDITPYLTEWDPDNSSANSFKAYGIIINSNVEVKIFGDGGSLG